MSDFVAVFSKAGRAREQLSAEQGQLIGSLNYQPESVQLLGSTSAAVMPAAIPIRMVETPAAIQVAAIAAPKSMPVC